MNLGTKTKVTPTAETSTVSACANDTVTSILNSSIYSIMNQPSIKVEHLNNEIDALVVDGVRYEIKKTATSKEKETVKSIPIIKKYIVNGPSVVVFFADGSKEVATCDVSDAFEVETGIMICILKKLCGYNFLSQIQKVVKTQTKFETLKATLAERKEKEHKEFLEAQKRRREAKLKRKIEKQVAFELAVEQLKAEKQKA